MSLIKKLNALVVRFRHLAAIAACPRPNVGISRTTRTYKFLVAFLNVTFVRRDCRIRDTNVTFTPLALALPCFAGLTCSLLAQSDTGTVGERVCLDSVEAELALSIDLVSRVPVSICEPGYQMVELRNRTHAPLGDIRLEMAAPVGKDKMSFRPLRGVTIAEAGANRWRSGGEAFFEISADAGVSWQPIGLPTGSGAPHEPFKWTVHEAESFSRLNPIATRGDSLLLRWRGALGDAFGSTLAPDPEFSFTARATDACGQHVATRRQRVALSVLRPALRAVVEGRNATRGGVFSDHVTAVPNDEIEWRVTVDNIGDATAKNAGVTFWSQAFNVGAGSPGQPRQMTALVEKTADGTERKIGSHRFVGRILRDGRSSFRVREKAPQICASRDIFAAPFWHCSGERADRETKGGLTTASRWAVGGAILDTAPDPAAISLDLSVSGINGKATAGDTALVTVVASNTGAPVFQPKLRVDLPDSYIFDESGEATVLVSAGRRVDMRVDTSDPAVPIFALMQDQAGILNTEQPVTIQFQMKRVRPTIAEEDDLVAALIFHDGCGTAFQSRSARLRVFSRRIRLKTTIEPADGPLVSKTDLVKTFNVKIQNSGGEVAQNIRARLSLGTAWAALADKRCHQSENKEYFFCSLAGPLHPGQSVTTTFDLHLAPDPEKAAFEGMPPLGVALTAEALSGETANTNVVATARASTSAIGFDIRQTLLTEAGAPWPEDVAGLDLGQRAILAVTALWFGVPIADLHSAAIQLSLPPPLAYKTDRTTVESDDTFSALHVQGGAWPSPGETGSVHWSIAPPSSAVGVATAIFTGKIEVEARDPMVPRMVETAIAAANFVFAGAEYGLDDDQIDQTTAAPLEVRIRRPQMSLALEFNEQDQGKTVHPFLVPGKRTQTVTFKLKNTGDRPAYFDWASLEAPPGVIIAPPGEDGVDNDGDGAIDEADEISLGAIEKRADGGVYMRWIAIPNAQKGFSPEAQRLAPNAAVRWHVALAASHGESPATMYQFKLSSRFGSAPFAETDGASRVTMQAVAFAKTPPIQGFASLLESSRSAISQTIRHNDRIRARARAVLPPGRIERLSLTVDIPPALTNLRPEIGVVGANIACSGGESPQILDATNAQPKRLVWPLGLCEVRAGGDAKRAVRLDFSAETRDVDPNVDAVDRARWRSPNIAAWVSYKGRLEDQSLGQRRVPLGDVALKLTGPLLAIRVEEALIGSPLNQHRQTAPDASDFVELILSVQNHGDMSSEGALMTFGAVDQTLIDCQSISIAPVRAKNHTPQPERNQCLAQIRLNDQASVPAGESRRFVTRFAIAPNATIAKTVDLRAVIDGASMRSSQWNVSLKTAEPKPPRVTFEDNAPLNGRIGLRKIGLGRQVAMVTEAKVPEGVMDGTFELRLKVPKAAIEAASADLFIVERDPESPTGTRKRLSIGERIQVKALDAGWVALRRNFRGLNIGHGSRERHWRTLRLVTRFTLAGAPALLHGDIVNVQPVLSLNVADQGIKTFTAPKEPAFVVSEPIVDAVAIIAADEGGTVLPTSDAETLQFIGRFCNRGDAQAYGLAVSGTLPEGFSRIKGAHRLTTRSDERIFATIQWQGRAFVAKAPGSNALAPRDCVSFAALATAQPGVSVDDAPYFELSVDSYRSGEDAARPGRVYRSTMQATAKPERQLLHLEGPRQAAAAAGDIIFFPFAISAAEIFTPLRVSVRAKSAIPWALFVDTDSNGRLTVNDQPLNGPFILEPGQRVTGIAQTRLPQSDREDWRDSVVLSAVATPSHNSGNGTTSPLQAKRLIAIAAITDSKRRLARTVATRRYYAADRNCDGALDDETGQDAAFEFVKNARAEECMTIRVMFGNRGLSPVSELEIEETAPPNTEIVPGSVKFEETPAGLVVRSAEVDGSSRLKFSYIGTLQPERHGWITYRVKVAAGI
jgi:hypothetical protein